MADVQGALRQQVESELSAAEGRIGVISHRLEQRELLDYVHYRLG
jgi:hypothetical protein